MEISRRGSGADYGPRQAQFPDPKFSWNDADGVLQIRQGRVRDFNTYADHDYTISVGLDEFVKMLGVVAEAALKDPARFAPELNSALAAILQLQAVGAGVVRA